MEQFSEEFSLIINNAAQLMIEQKQKLLTISHISYSFFSNDKINLIGQKYISNYEDLKEELLALTKTYETIDENPEISEKLPDLTDETKEIIQKCISNIYNLHGSSVTKVTSFDFMEVVAQHPLDNSIFSKYGITYDIISKIRSKYINESIKVSLKRKNLSKSAPAKKEVVEDKNDVRNFTTNITEKVIAEKPVIFDFDNKIEDIINVLLRKEKSNPLLIGKPGVGKSVLVEGLALAIANKKVPKELIGKKVIEINLTSLISGTNFRGDFEKRFENIINYLEEENDVIVFIDEIHCMKGLGSTGSSKGELDFSNMIKPYLSSGKISCIGATTFDEYKNSIEKDKALDRRFKTIDLKEPNIEITKEILLHKKKVYENFHGVKIDNKMIALLVELTNRFVTKGSFPDKAFDVLDMCLSTAKKNSVTKVDEDCIIETIAKISNVDKDQIKGVDTVVLSLEEQLNQKIFGQEKAIKSISDKILVAKSGLSNPLKPLASFLLIGTTGVGKTEVVNEISKKMSMEFLRLDMSEYSERGSSSKLIGTSAGYIGYEDGGKLTDFIIRNPHTVVLFDEIEKADKSIYNLFLQILDYGKITDGSGREVDFRNTLIFMTSNAGVEELNTNRIGFKQDSSLTNDKFESSIMKTFSPEFLNRISKIIKFEKLGQSSMNALVNKNLEDIKLKLKEKEVIIEFTDTVINAVIKNGFNEKMGARPLERYIEDNITFLIATNMIKNTLLKKTKYKIDFVDNEFKLIK